MTKDKAMKLALEALTKLTDAFLDTEGRHGDYERQALDQGNKALASLQEALAQPEHPEQMARLGWQYVECPACGSEGARAFPKPEGQPVAWEQFYPDIGKPQIALNAEVVGYVAPQRTWVGLTNEEMPPIPSAYRDKSGTDYEKLHAKWRKGRQELSNLTRAHEALLAKVRAEKTAPQERSSFAEWTSDYVRDNLHKLKPAQQEPLTDEQMIAQAVEAEREACAQVVWKMKGQCWAYDHDTISAAIRARGEASIRENT